MTQLHLYEPYDGDIEGLIDYWEEELEKYDELYPQPAREQPPHVKRLRKCIMDVEACLENGTESTRD